MTAAFMQEMKNNTQPIENLALQRESERLLLQLGKSKAWLRAVGMTMGSGGYGSIKMDIARGKVKRIVSEAVFLEED